MQRTTSFKLFLKLQNIYKQSYGLKVIKNLFGLYSQYLIEPIICNLSKNKRRDLIIYTIKEKPIKTPDVFTSNNVQNFFPGNIIIIIRK